MVNLFKYLRCGVIKAYRVHNGERNWFTGTLSSTTTLRNSCMSLYLKSTNPELNTSQKWNLLQSSRSIYTSTLSLLPLVPFKLSDIGEGIKEVTFKEWFVKEGDKVNQFDQICEVQSDKASVTITSRFDGIVRKLHYKIEDIALVGAPLVDIEVQEAAGVSSTDHDVQEGDAIQVGKSEASIRLPEEEARGEKVLATPAVRRMAAEYKIDLKDIQGTGKDGRILKEDVQNFIDGKTPKSVASAAPTPPSRPVQLQTPTPVTSAVKKTLPLKLLPSVATTAIAADRKEPIKGYTKTMIKTMTAGNAIPHFGYCDEINLTELMKLRKEFQKLKRKYIFSFLVLEFSKICSKRDSKNYIFVTNNNNAAMRHDIVEEIIK